MSGQGSASSKKLKSAQPKEELKATWTQDFTDFTISLASGKELKCHKVTLAENSSVFATMLNSELEEGKTNKMKLDHFDDVTVFHFLEYIYARLEYISDAGQYLYKKKFKQVTEKLTITRYAHHTERAHMYNVYKKNFQKEKCTLDLYKMAHMYGTKDLLADCTEHLKATLTDENVMEVWKEASKYDNTVLREAVASHLKTTTSQHKFLEFLDALERGVKK